MKTRQRKKLYGLRRSYSRLMTKRIRRKMLQRVLASLLIACMCCSFAAGQSPAKADDFRPRPNPTIIPNGIDVPKLIDAQPQPGITLPKLQVYLLVVADDELTQRERDWIHLIFKTHVQSERMEVVQQYPVNKEEEIKKFLSMVDEVDAKRKSSSWMLTWQPWIVGGMMGAAFVLIMSACQDRFRWSSYRDQGLVK